MSGIADADAQGVGHLIHGEGGRLGLVGCGGQHLHGHVDGGDDLGFVLRLLHLDEGDVDGVAHGFLAVHQHPLHGVSLSHFVGAVHVVEGEGSIIGKSLEELHADLGVGTPLGGIALAVEPAVVAVGSTVVGIEEDALAIGLLNVEHVGAQCIHTEESLGLSEVGDGFSGCVAQLRGTLMVDGEVEFLWLGLLLSVVGQLCLGGIDNEACGGVDDQCSHMHVVAAQGVLQRCGGGGQSHGAGDLGGLGGRVGLSLNLVAAVLIATGQRHIVEIESGDRALPVFATLAPVGQVGSSLCSGVAGIVVQLRPA